MYWSKQLPAPQRTIIDLSVSDEEVGLGVIWEDAGVQWSVCLYLFWVQLLVIVVNKEAL